MRLSISRINTARSIGTANYVSLKRASDAVAWAGQGRPCYYFHPFAKLRQTCRAGWHRFRRLGVRLSTRTIPAILGLVLACFPRPNPHPHPHPHAPSQTPNPRPTQRPHQRPTQRPNPRPNPRPTQRPHPRPNPTPALIYALNPKSVQVKTRVRAVGTSCPAMTMKIAPNRFLMSTIWLPRS